MFKKLVLSAVMASGVLVPAVKNPDKPSGIEVTVSIQMDDIQSDLAKCYKTDDEYAYFRNALGRVFKLDLGDGWIEGDYAVIVYVYNDESMNDVTIFKTFYERPDLVDKPEDECQEPVIQAYAG